MPSGFPPARKGVGSEWPLVKVTIFTGSAFPVSAAMRDFHELAAGLVVKGSGITFLFFTLHGAFFRATASRFDTLLQLPIARPSTTHYNVIVLSCRNRTAIATFP